MVVKRKLDQNENNDEIIEAVGYIRQSDEREDKEDISEQTQMAKIQSFCDMNNWKLVGVFKDIDYSGFRISYLKRPGLMNAFEYINSHKRVRKFVAFNLSRITRRKKDFILIHESLSKLKVDICSTAELLDFSSPTGRMVANILVNLNEYFSDNLSDITNDSKEINAKKGRWNGGPAPFGIIKKDGVFIEDGFKAEAVKQAFHLAKEGKGTYIISNWLNSESILTHTGVKWTPRRVRYMLNNISYTAMQKWKGVLYPLMNFPSLVSTEDFMYIQRTLFGKDNMWRGKNRQLLSSILRCPMCGSKMHSRQTSSKKTRRYVCSSKNSNGNCKSPVIDLPSLNDAILKRIVDISNGRYSKEQISSKIIDETDNTLSVIQHLQTESRNLEIAIQNVFDDFYMHQKLSEQHFSDLMKRYEKKQIEINKKLENMPIPKTNNKYGNFDELLSELAIAFELGLDSNDKRIMTELIIEKIIPNKITEIHFRWGEIQEINYTKSGYGKNEVLYF
ncbi:recombinase family protein [Paenibacillus sinopodophylli]|uniref:recombinase family protein n=1 Tax=Paenibacillus sinopodophylli TaxID=1837342 RepID=UPI00110C9CDD|nr:recombinase family protein [Paenibacillus sinopodophylli]